MRKETSQKILSSILISSFSATGLSTSKRSIEQAIDGNVFYAIGLGAISAFLFLRSIPKEYSRFRGDLQTK